MVKPNPHKLRAIVVDDERLPRLSLLQKLDDFSNDIDIIGSCDSYDSSLQTILQEKPDLVFLDIQLQGKDAIQLLSEIQQIQSLPYVIFTTAYNERNYLMSAIKISAVDYLIKPIDKNELAIAIAKAVDRRLSEDKSQQNHAVGTVHHERMSLKTVNGMLVLKESDIVYLRAYGNYSKLTTFNQTETIMEPLGALECRLDGNMFVRCDRSTVVNLTYIYKIDTKRHICVFKSSDGSHVQLEISKSGMDALVKLL